MHWGINLRYSFVHNHEEFNTILQYILDDATYE